MSTNLLKSLNKLYFDNIDKTIDDYQIFDYIIGKINNNNKIYKKEHVNFVFHLFKYPKRRGKS